MIVCSLNVRGLGGGVKRRYIKNLIHSEQVDFMALQETKVEVISDSLCCGLWGGRDCDWVFLPSVGNSGGILSMWRKANSTLLFSFSDEGFVGVCLEWGVLKKVCFVVNVYAKCDINAKQRLWTNLLMSKRGFGDGAWCVVGDFNAVRAREERVGASSPSSYSLERREFDGFIGNLKLEDLYPVGGRFTWFHSNGVAMSRLDRMLVSEEWLNLWGIQILRILPRVVSDHCPLILKSCIVESRPKPFRFCNHWLLHKDFKELVEGAWGAMNVEGWMGHVLKEKLKLLKTPIRDWNRVVYGKMEDSISNIISRIREKDVRGEQGLLTGVEVGERRKLFGDLWKLLKSKEVLLAQKSRVKWLKDGDSNSKYFHACLKSRERSNAIVCLKVGERWLDSSAEIIEEVLRYFKNHFSASYWARPRLGG
jgi:hypothetical protein